MDSSWVSLIPPLLVIATAAATHRVILSLVLGIVSAALISSGFAPLASGVHIYQAIHSVITTAGNIYLFLFLIALGTLIESITHSGGVAAYTALLKRFVHNRRGAETASLCLSLVFCIDDYLNSLMTGSIMRPLTDSFRIPRVKLAFLLNSMSSPLCTLIPITTWAAMILGQLHASGISENGSTNNALIAADPFLTYLASIPFIFYSFFIIGSSWIIVRTQLSFGPMHQQEVIAQTSGNLFGNKEPIGRATDMDTKGEGSLAHFIIPIITFIIAALGFVLYTGKNVLFGGSNGIIETIKHASTTWSLMMASFTALIASSILMIKERHPLIRSLSLAAYRGVLSMKNSLIVLFLAFTFGVLLDQLHTGEYLAQLISASLPTFLLPLLIFALATITTASTGSSWGAIAILMGLVVKTLAALSSITTLPLTPADVPVFFISIGALIAGSVAGAHLSPITDATVVSSMSAAAYHIDHVKTLITYAFPALFGSGVAFLVGGLTYKLGLLTCLALSAGIGFGITVLLLWSFNRLRNDARPLRQAQDERSSV